MIGANQRRGQSKNGEALTTVGCRATVARMSKQPPPKVAAVRIVATLCSVYVVSQFFRASHAVVAPDLARDLMLTPGDLGLLTGAFFVSFGAAQIPIGMLLDRFGPRRTVSSLLLFAVAGAVLFARADGLAALTVARICMGVGCAGVLVGSLVVCARWFPPDRYATFAGIIIGGGETGHLLAATPFASLAESVGWRNAFLIAAGVAAVLTVVAWVGVRDVPPGEARDDTAGESLGDMLRGVGEALRMPAIGPVLAIAFVGYSSALCVFGLWGAPMLNDVYRLDAIARGNVMLIMAAAMLAGSLSYGPMDRRFDTRKGVVMVSCGALATAFLTLALLDRPPLWAVTVLFAVIGYLGGHRVAMMAHGRSLFPARLVGRGVTTVNTSMVAGVAVMQIATGLIVGGFADGGSTAPAIAYRAAFGFIACVLIAAMVVYRRAEDRKPSEGAGRLG
jgi:predicted MFS family arabinose efflux permease